MAGKIIADTIQAAGDRITFNVGEITVMTANSAGLTYIPTANVNLNIANPGSITVGNLTVTSNIILTGTLTNGIKFPATQVDSSDANTLDDYEEGTWTPAYYGSTTAGTISYESRAGKYTKVGNRVDVWFSLTNFTSSGAVGDLRISGLPFLCSGGSGSTVRGCFSGDFRFYNIDIPATPFNVTSNLDSTGQNSFNFICSNDNSSWSAISVKNGSTLYIEGHMCYFTS